MSGNVHNLVEALDATQDRIERLPSEGRNDLGADLVNRNDVLAAIGHIRRSPDGPSDEEVARANWADLYAVVLHLIDKHRVECYHGEWEHRVDAYRIEPEDRPQRVNTHLEEVQSDDDQRGDDRCERCNHKGHRHEVTDSGELGRCCGFGPEWPSCDCMGFALDAAPAPNEERRVARTAGEIIDALSQYDRDEQVSVHAGAGEGWAEMTIGRDEEGVYIALQV